MGAAMQPPWACRLCVWPYVPAVGGLAGWIARCRCCGRWAAGCGWHAPPGCCAPVCLAGRSFPRPCASFWVCWRCGWRGLPWCRRASSVSISCCRCSPWCGWLTSLRILPAGLLACALPATSWHPPSALAKAGRGFGAVWRGCCAWPWPGLRLTVISRRTSPVFIPACIPRAGGSWPSPWCSWWP